MPLNNQTRETRKDTRILLFLVEHYTIKTDIIRYYSLQNSTDSVQSASRLAFVAVGYLLTMTPCPQDAVLSVLCLFAGLSLLPKATHKC